MQCRLSLDSLGDIDGEFDAIFAQRTCSCCAIDRGTTVAAENTTQINIGISGEQKNMGGTNVAVCCCGLKETGSKDTGASRSIDIFAASIRYV